MAGELTIDTLHSTVAPFATGNAFSGIAKAWVNFNGTASPPTIRGSFNVGSVTKNSTGNYTITFASPLSNANYAVSTSLSSGATGVSAINYTAQVESASAAPASSAFNVQTGLNWYTQAAVADVPYVYVSVFGA